MYIEQKYLLLVSPQLQQFKKKGDYLYNFRCPYCGDSKKSRTKARGFIFRKENNLIYKCHNCGKGANLQNFLKYVDSKIYNDYILERYKKSEKVEPDIGKFTKPKFLKGDSPLKSIQKVSSLQWNHSVKELVVSRKIPSNVHFELFYSPQFYKWVNTIIPNKFASLVKDHARLVIPFFDENNKMFALQGRAIGNEEPKYITITLDTEKQKIYGLNRVDWNKTVYVVEGPLDSLFLDNCVATAQSDLRIKNRDNLVLIPDNEPRNLEIVKQIEKYINENYSVVLWPDYVEEKDINEMILSGKTKEDITNIIEKNTYSGVRAKIEFTKWSKINAKQSSSNNLPRIYPPLKIL